MDCAFNVSKCFAHSRTELTVRLSCVLMTSIVLAASVSVLHGNARAASPSESLDRSPHKVQFVSVEPGVSLEVLDWGGTGRPVVFLAGAGCTAHIYDEFAPHLNRY